MRRRRPIRRRGCLPACVESSPRHLTPRPTFFVGDLCNYGASQFSQPAYPMRKARYSRNHQEPKPHTGGPRERTKRDCFSRSRQKSSATKPTDEKLNSFRSYPSLQGVVIPNVAPNVKGNQPPNANFRKNIFGGEAGGMLDLRAGRPPRHPAPARRRPTSDRRTSAPLDLRLPH